MILQEGLRREIAVVVQDGVERVDLQTALQGYAVAIVSDAARSSVTFALQGREIMLYHRKNLASVQGDLRLLSGTVLFEGGQWLVPVESLPRLLGPLLGLATSWRADTRVLLMGDVRIPRATAKIFASADVVRVVIEASEKVPFQVSQAPDRLAVAIPRDAIDVGFTQERLTGGIVEEVGFEGGKDNVFYVKLGPRFENLRAYELDGPPRLVLELQAPPIELRPAPPAPSPRRSETMDGKDGGTAEVRVVVIDPGHGGDEVGALGPNGTFEKDVTLSLARKLRAALTNRLGIQAFLTRDRDEYVALDTRAGIANNYKADLFISLHANASRSHGARGSEVYFLSYQATDDESRRVALLEGGFEMPERAPDGSDLALVLWDMAQAAHLEESSNLASCLLDELSEMTGDAGRGVKQAPFRVLVGAAMPAALVEVAFISNPEEEQLLVSEEHQNKIATALTRGIARYARERLKRMGYASSGALSKR
ncbi:MAG: N-acetylmuramoyl-L-alanine amidase [Vicinamibacteria bacterium]|nr:N-acetylmuramoyl-L-alanine amidase [Vicinamibacteria bacterium]